MSQRQIIMLHKNLQKNKERKEMISLVLVQFVWVRGSCGKRSESPRQRREFAGSREHLESEVGEVVEAEGHPLDDLDLVVYALGEAVAHSQRWDSASAFFSCP